MHLKEFKAWITIDGKEAVEYDVQTSEDQKTVTCWIASELGKVPYCVPMSIWTDAHARVARHSL